MCKYINTHTRGLAGENPAIEPLVFLLHGWMPPGQPSCADTYVIYRIYLSISQTLSAFCVRSAGVRGRGVRELSWDCVCTCTRVGVRAARHNSKQCASASGIGSLMVPAGRRPGEGSAARIPFVVSHRTVVRCWLQLYFPEGLKWGQRTHVQDGPLAGLARR